MTQLWGNRWLVIIVILLFLTLHFPAFHCVLQGAFILLMLNSLSVFVVIVSNVRGGVWAVAAG